MRGLWLETGSIEQTKALECRRLKGDYESQSARPSESSEVSSQLTESNLCTIPCMAMDHITVYPSQLALYCHCHT